MGRACQKLLLIASALAAIALPATAQITLTGAVNFSTNSTGAAYDGQVWNTLGGDSFWDLWLSLEPAGTLPVNGPADSQAGIDLTLQAGGTYKFYIFGQPGASTGFNGLNLFFNGSNSAPAISAFGPTNSPSFAGDANTTYNSQGNQVAGSGTTFYSSGGVTAVLTTYEWNAPTNTSPDVCQAHAFTPGNGPDFFGSFTLHVSPAAALIVSPGTGAPGTAITIAGSGYAPLEKINIYVHEFGLTPRYSTTADAFGAFSLTSAEAQAPYGYEEYFAVGESSGDLGTAAAFVSPALILSPKAGFPGGTVKVQGVGFGAREAVQIYWNSPRELVGTAVANIQGSFVSANGVDITIPLNSPLGINGVIGVGETTKAVGLGAITVE